MKNAKRALALVLTMLPLLAAAQLKQDDKLVTKVPFHFIIANKTVPAGEWTLRAASDGARTVVLRNVDANMALFSTAAPEITRKPAASCALVFNKYGEQYFLAAVKIAGSNMIYRVPESKAEAEMRAQNVIPAETILLASVK